MRSEVGPSFNSSAKEVRFRSSSLVRKAPDLYLIRFCFRLEYEPLLQRKTA